MCRHSTSSCQDPGPGPQAARRTSRPEACQRAAGRRIVAHDLSRAVGVGAEPQDRAWNAILAGGALPARIVRQPAEGEMPAIRFWSRGLNSSPWPAFRWVMIFTALGDNNEAFRWLNHEPRHARVA